MPVYNSLYVIINKYNPTTQYSFWLMDRRHTKKLISLYVMKSKRPAQKHRNYLLITCSKRIIMRCMSLQLIYNLNASRNLTVQLLWVAKVSITNARSMFCFTVPIIGNFNILRLADPNTFLIFISEFFRNGNGMWSTNFPQKCLYGLKAYFCRFSISISNPSTSAAWTCWHLWQPNCRPGY